YVRNQVNPAKSIKVLMSCIGHENRLHERTGKVKPIDHETYQYVIKQNGYNIDPPASAEAVREEINKRMKGQTLAVRLIGDAINNAFYAPRNRNKQLIVALSLCSMCTGKTETAKATA